MKVKRVGRMVRKGRRRPILSVRLEGLKLVLLDMVLVR